MSLLSAQSIAYRAYEIAVSRGLVPAGFEREMVLPMVNNALFNLAEEVISDGDYREFQKTITGQSITSGVLTLSDSTLLLASIPYGRVTVSTSPAFFAPTYDALRAAKPSADYWFTIEGMNLVFADTDGTLGSLNAASNVTIVGCTIPTLPNLPSKYDPRLVEEVVSLLSGTQKPPQLQVVDSTGAQ